MDRKEQGRLDNFTDMICAQVNDQADKALAPLGGSPAPPGILAQKRKRQASGKSRKATKGKTSRKRRPKSGSESDDDQFGDDDPCENFFKNVDG